MFSDAINPGPQHDVDYGKGSAVATCPCRAQAIFFQLGLAGLILVRNTDRLPNLPCTCLARGVNKLRNPLMTPTTDLGLSIRVSMFEIRETGDWDILPGTGEGGDQYRFSQTASSSHIKPFFPDFRIEQAQWSMDKEFFCGE